MYTILILLCRLWISDSYLYEIIRVSELSSATVPCLFVHGHRGHHSQALGLSFPLSFACELYTLDLKEDISGLSHEVLYKQAAFISESLQNLSYQFSSKVILIGHSMGGVSALLSALTSFSLIKQIITLNSPLESSPINTYYAFPYLYYRIHSFLAETGVPYISISGGADSTVPASLTKPQEIYNKHIYTSQMPGVYKQLDHNQILHDNGFLMNFPKIIKGDFERSEVQRWLNPADIEDFDYCREHSFITGEVGIGEFSLMEGGDYNAIFKKNGDIIVFTNGTLEKVVRRFLSISAPPITIAPLYIHKITVEEDDEVSFHFYNRNQMYLNIYYLEKYADFTTFQMIFSGYTIDIRYVACIFVEKPMRYPINIALNTTAIWIYAKCGSEEIIQRYSQMATFFFHENCEAGFEIWIFSQSAQAKLQIFIDDIANVFIREFRLYIFSIAISLFLSNSSRVYSLAFLFIFFIVHHWTRYLGLFGLDHTDYQFKTISIIEFFFIIICAAMISKLLEMLYKIIGIATRYLPVIQLSKKHMCLLLMIFIIPWPIFFVSLAMLLQNSQIRKDDCRVLIVSGLITLPQSIAWFWRLLNFGHVGIINIHDFVAIAPVVCILITTKYRYLNIRNSACLALSGYFMIFVQDLIYRGNIMISIYLCGLTLETWLDIKGMRYRSLFTKTLSTK